MILLYIVFIPDYFSITTPIKVKSNDIIAFGRDNDVSVTAYTITDKELINNGLKEIKKYINYLMKMFRNWLIF